jgi:hypothetical protein
MVSVTILTSSGEPQKATLTSTGLLPPCAKAAAAGLFEHPEFAIIKEQAHKMIAENLRNFMPKPFTSQQAVGQVLICPTANFT